MAAPKLLGRSNSSAYLAISMQVTFCPCAFRRKDVLGSDLRLALCTLPSELVSRGGRFIAVQSQPGFLGHCSEKSRWLARPGSCVQSKTTCRTVGSGLDGGLVVHLAGNEPPTAAPACFRRFPQFGMKPVCHSEPTVAEYLKGASRASINRMPVFRFSIGSGEQSDFKRNLFGLCMFVVPIR